MPEINYKPFSTRLVMNKRYIFAVYVNGKVCKVYDWFCETDREMKLQACALCAGVRAFKKSAGILVYKLQEERTFLVCHSVNFNNSWYIYQYAFPLSAVENFQLLPDILNGKVNENKEIINK